MGELRPPAPSVNREGRAESGGTFGFVNADVDSSRCVLLGVGGAGEAESRIRLEFINESKLESFVALLLFSIPCWLEVIVDDILAGKCEQVLLSDWCTGAEQFQKRPEQDTRKGEKNILEIVEGGDAQRPNKATFKELPSIVVAARYNTEWCR